ncbi:MAG: NADH-quinone oxidoreductase subunit NuoN [Pseudomonadota bacterium]
MNELIAYIAPAAPELFVFAGACLLLVIDVFLPASRRDVTYWLAQALLAGAIVVTWQGLDGATAHAYHHMYVTDRLAELLKLVIYGLTMFAFAYSRDYLRARDMYRGEYFVLALFAVLGMMVMASAANFLTLYLGLELLSLSLYAMIALRRDSAEATEAAMKYFVLGAIASGVLLYGLSLVYGMTHSLDIATLRQALTAKPMGDNMVLILGLVFVLSAIAFKLGAVPFHMWVPDVYHGAPTSVTLFLGTAPKVAGFALVARLLLEGFEPLSASWQPILILMAVLSMGLGNLLAIAQTNIKRMLAYSSISHMGFFLLGVLSLGPNGYSSALFYMLVYAVMSLAGFGVILLMSRAGMEAENISDFKGLNQRSPWFAFLMLLVMFSMAGVPPLAGFYAKFLVIQAVVKSDMLWLAIVAVLFAVIGAYYYLRVIKVMYFDEPDDKSPVTGSGPFRVLLSINALALLAVMPVVGWVIELCRRVIGGTY